MAINPQTTPIKTKMGRETFIIMHKHSFVSFIFQDNFTSVLLAFFNVDLFSILIALPKKQEFVRNQLSLLSLNSHK